VTSTACASRPGITAAAAAPPPPPPGKVDTDMRVNPPWQHCIMPAAQGHAPGWSAARGFAAVENRTGGPTAVTTPPCTAPWWHALVAASGTTILASCVTCSPCRPQLQPLEQMCCARAQLMCGLAEHALPSGLHMPVNMHGCCIVRPVSAAAMGSACRQLPCTPPALCAPCRQPCTQQAGSSLVPQSATTQCC
jgi:hypothetical protein